MALFVIAVREEVLQKSGRIIKTILEIINKKQQISGNR
jgi:hypothetical protein